MTEIGILIKNKAMEHTFTEAHKIGTKGSGETDWKTVKENTFTKMEMFMKGISQMGSKKEKGYLSGEKDRLMKEVLNQTWWMALEWWEIKKESKKRFYLKTMK